MKKIIFTVAALMALNVNAKSSKLDKCYQVEELAENIMMARQQGNSMGDLMKIAEGNTLVENIVADAFDFDFWNSEDMKQKEVNKFKTLWFKACYENIKESI